MLEAKPRIAVVGAGLGGLTLARTLGVRGWEATVFERDESASQRTQGGTFDLHPETGIFAVNKAGLSDAFARLARNEDQGLRIFDNDAKLQFEERMDSRPEIDRGQLRGMLIDSLAPGVVQWGQALKAARPVESGGWELEFHSGITERFDLVVGADGAWSRVRPLLSADQPGYTGLTFFELEIADVDTRHPAVGALVSRGLLIAAADRKTLFAQRNANGSVRVYAALRVEEITPVHDGVRPSVANKTREQIAVEFRGWSAALVDLVELAGEEVRPWPIYTLPVGHQWTSRRGVTLLGDAAHLMPPAGDGANLAMRDGVDLAGAIADADDWRKAVATYEIVMQERAGLAADNAMRLLVTGSMGEDVDLVQEALKQQ